jgi:hypothetical protein
MPGGRELSRRIRDDLVHLGLVSAGDLIVCTQDDHSIETGDPGRTLANGDLLKVEAITRRGLVVRRTAGTDPAWPLAFGRGGCGGPCGPLSWPG